LGRLHLASLLETEASSGSEGRARVQVGPVKREGSKWRVFFNEILEKGRVGSGGRNLEGTGRWRRSPLRLQGGSFELEARQPLEKGTTRLGAFVRNNGETKHRKDMKLGQGSAQVLEWEAAKDSAVQVWGEFFRVRGTTRRMDAKAGKNRGEKKVRADAAHFTSAGAERTERTGTSRSELD